MALKSGEASERNLKRSMRGPETITTRRACSSEAGVPVEFCHRPSVISQRLTEESSSSTELLSSATSIDTDHSVSLTASIRVTGTGREIPTAAFGMNRVKFVDGAITLTGTITYSINNGKRIDGLTVYRLTVGTHQIKAVYAGDANFSASSSTVL